MAQQTPKSDSFWVSYSDLATGLMIVFMVVMLIMVIMQKQTGEVQTDRVQEVVRKIEIILGQKSKLSDSINKGFANDASITADPVTAQLSIDETLLQFSENRARIKTKGRQFLKSFGPQYICTLFAHEKRQCNLKSSDCRRLDPDTPGGVRRIYVQGHADMKGKFAKNHQLSAERAETVVQTLLKDLRCVSDGKCKAIFDSLDEECKKNPSAMLGYAEERLWAVGAGETLHCTNALNTLDSPRAVERCDALIRSDPQFRKVNFSLEITGDDMTGLLADVVALRDAVGSKSGTEAPIDELSKIVAQKCWQDPFSYHGCRTFAVDCLSTDSEKDTCDEFFAQWTDAPLNAWVKNICTEEELLKCLELP
ncbi:MAG: hypothetical protein VXZ96_20685 [Myxococcota bacterium]|nr:hypothetical protein [Myxococcota bacterium]